MSRVLLVAVRRGGAPIIREEITDADRGGGGSSGGGVCAQAMREKRHADAESRLTAIFFNNSGVKHYKKKDYIKAVSSFETAINQDPSYSVAKNNLSNALAGLGVQAYARRDYESSLLYHERALELRDSLNHRNNVKSSRRKVKNGGKKTCTMCSKAYISDVGYGLGQSASFMNYVAQATNNFTNCTRKISGSCSRSSGQSFYGVLRATCFKQYRRIGEKGYKACVKSARADARRRFSRLGR